MKAAASIILLMTFSALAWSSGKPLLNAKAIDRVASDFAAQLKAEDFATAYNFLSPYALASDEAFATTSQKGIAQLKQVAQNAGKIVDVARVKTDELEGHFYKITYLLKYPQAAIVCELNFYQPEEGWHVVDVTYHTNINQLF